MDLLFNILVKVAIYICFLISLNSLMLGKLNLWAIGNIVYFSIGAYVAGLLANVFSLTSYRLYSSFIIAPLITSMFSLIFYYLSRVLKNDFFLFFSLFFIELMFVLNNIMAGPSGYSNISRPPGLQSDVGILIVLITFLGILITWLHYFNKSRINSIHSIIISNEIFAQSMGINIKKMQIPIFILSAIISGIAGVFFAFFSFGTQPSVFNINEIIILFSLILFSGVDSIKGSIIAGFIYVFLVYFLDSILTGQMKLIAPKVSQMLFGLLLIVIPFLYPKGLFGNRPLN